MNIEIHNPPINLLDLQVVAELEALLDDLEGNDAIKVVVFRSALADYFVNHYDMSPRGVPAPVAGRPPLAPLFRLLARTSRLPQVTIAEIRGRVRGAGSELALALDMRFASRERARFGQPEVGIGLHPGAGGTQRLPALMGRARALEVMLSGADVSADIAEQYGWINRAMPDAMLGPWVHALAVRIASFPALGLRNIKRFVNASFLPQDAILAEESAAFREAMGHAELRERLGSLFARGAQTASDLELELGEAIASHGGA